MKLTQFEYRIALRLLRDETRKGQKNGKVYTIKHFEALYELERKLKLNQQRSK